MKTKLTLIGTMAVTMRGERPEAPNNIFMRCGKLKSIHVPANAKSWAGMKEWQGIRPPPTNIAWAQRHASRADAANF